MSLDEYKLATPPDNDGCRCDECNNYFDCFDMKSLWLNFKELDLCPECYKKINE